MTKLLNTSGATGHYASKQAQMLTAAVVAGVKLCKAATYINVNDFFANVVYSVLQGIVDDLKVQ